MLSSPACSEQLFFPRSVTLTRKAHTYILFFSLISAIHANEHQDPWLWEEAVQKQSRFKKKIIIRLVSFDIWSVSRWRESRSPFPEVFFTLTAILQRLACCKLLLLQALKAASRSLFLIRDNESSNCHLPAKPGMVFAHSLFLHLRG